MELWGRRRVALAWTWPASASHRRTSHAESVDLDVESACIALRPLAILPIRPVTMRLLASAVALMAAASTLLVAAAKHPLTPEDLILAPKTAHEFALSPSHNHIAYPVSYSSLDKGGKTRKEVHVIEVPSSDDLATGPQLQRSSSPTVLHDVGYAAWIDDEHLVYVNYSALYTLALSDSNSPVKLLDLPAPIAEDSLRVVAGKGNADRHLVFAAEVYQDGELEGVKRVESEENEEEWGRVKAYDGDNG